MFSRFSRLPLRRCIHTGPSASNSSTFFSRRAGTVLGASAVMTAYMTWHLTNERNRIALDAPVSSKPSSTPLAKETRSNEPLTVHDIVPTPVPGTVGDQFVPDAPEETAISSPEKENEDSSSDSAASGEGKASSGGAYNPETGEINWDCPCLGGMAHGPCGPEFREAFSCFIYSEEEPKGINCVEKFQNMQNCFRAHPEVYADEIMDDDDDEASEGASDVPPSTQSADKLDGEASVGSDATQTQKPQIDGASISSDSSL
ncbi:hypothetical protein D9613_000749 [Agrocybe pediades]|uniref:Mitochondrial intermembrane space import and assembly protein 40 n=1 Tax=Agrocybe pediades TaxID=84607 RepID=A0A8H4VUE0_9AGAR|nr:hypothetical protein D9613_000749 [Agrocybe pediades]